jgi:hypothetical protein
VTGTVIADPIRIGVLGADDAVANMQLIDDCYRAAGLTPRPAREPLIKEIQP